MASKPQVTSLNLQLLAQFEALIRERHVSRAAERVGIGQPAMSSALARLRVLFSDPLLVRTAKGMVPTPKALELAKRVHMAIELLEPKRIPSRDFDPATSDRHFRILATEGLALVFAPRIGAHLRAYAPGVRLTVQPADMRHTVEALRDQECDVTISNIPHAPPDLRKTLLFQQRACCIVSASHPEIGERMTMKQCLAYPHVVWGSESQSYRSIETMVAHALADRGSFRAGVMRVPNILIVPAMVAATDMIATVPVRVANEAAATLAIRKVRPPFKLGDPDINMFWHELNHRDPGHMWFRGVVQQIAREQQGTM